MPYVPKNASVYVAAYRGVMVSLAAFERGATALQHITFEGISDIAAEFAEAFDTAWGVKPATAVDLAFIRELTFSAWERRKTANLALMARDADSLIATILKVVDTVNDHFAYEGLPTDAIDTGLGVPPFPMDEIEAQIAAVEADIAASVEEGMADTLAQVGWRTAIDIDFTALPTQALEAIGTYTIGGYTAQRQNQSLVAGLGFNITNGVGLSIQNGIAGGTSYIQNTRNAPLLWFPLASLIPEWDWDTRWRARIQMGAITVTAGTGGGCVMAIDNGITTAITATNSPHAVGMDWKVTANANPLNTYYLRSFIYNALAQSSGDSGQLKDTTAPRLGAFISKSHGLMTNGVTAISALSTVRWADKGLRRWQPQSFVAQSNVLTASDQSKVNSGGNTPNVGLTLGVYRDTAAALNFGFVIEKVKLEYLNNNH